MIIYSPFMTIVFRKMYNERALNVSSGYKLEDDSSDGQITQDSNDASDDHGQQLGTHCNAVIHADIYLIIIS